MNNLNLFENHSVSEIKNPSMNVKNNIFLLKKKITIQIYLYHFFKNKVWPPSQLFRNRFENIFVYNQHYCTLDPTIALFFCKYKFARLEFFIT